jgi:hypothetical protein
MSDLSETAEVDLGVDGGRRQVPVPKDLADLNEVRAPAEQLGSQGVAEPMGAHRCETRPSTRSADDVTAEVRPEGAAGRTDGQEHPPPVVPGPALPQVGDEGLAHVGGQRQPVVSARLAPNHELAGSPVQIAQLQAGHLDRAQPETGQQLQDGEVPHAQWWERSQESSSA